MPSSFSRTLTPRRQGRSQGDTRPLARRRVAPESRPQSHLRRSRRRQPVRIGAGVQSARCSRSSASATTVVPNPIALSPRVGFSKTLRRVAADLDRRRLRARPTPAHRRRHRRVSGIAGAVAHEPRDLQYRSAERGPDADVRRRRRAGSALGELSRRSVECAEHVRRRHDGIGVRDVAAGRHARRSQLSGVAALERGPQLDRAGCCRIASISRVAGSYALNLDQQGEIDLNFPPTQRFALASEGGRPVYVAVEQHRAGDRLHRVGRRARLARTSRASRSSTRDSAPTPSRSSSASRRRAFNSNFTWNASYTRSWNRRLDSGLQQHRRQSARSPVGRQRS